MRTSVPPTHTRWAKTSTWNGPHSRKVPDALRTRYDKIRNKKRVHVVVALNALSCGACDTAIPMQRRHTMLTGNVVELCEVCGVLMYHAV